MNEQPHYLGVAKERGVQPRGPEDVLQHMQLKSS